MKLMILPVLLVTLVLLEINQWTVQADDNSDDNLSLFKALKVSNSDCNPTETHKSIKMLTGETVEKDLALSRTDFAKVRKYLVRKGFLELPGSLLFQNSQDDTIHLLCSPDEKRETRWSSQGRRSDKGFAEEGHKRNKLSDEAPSSYLYFRRIFCNQRKNGCQHAFYIITKPYPRIKKPQQYREGEEIEIACTINPCIYDNTKRDECKIPYLAQPRFHPPVTLGWTLPYGEKNAIVTEMTLNMTAFPDLNITVELETKGTDEWGTKIASFPKATTLKITKAMKKHAGEYECVIIDQNGVPSTLGDTVDDFQFGGEVQVHVREWWWVYVPMIVMGILCIVTMLLAFCCPRSMEHDDGTKYTKDELATQATLEHEQDAKKKVQAPAEEPKVTETVVENDSSKPDIVEESKQTKSSSASTVVVQPTC